MALIGKIRQRTGFLLGTMAVVLVLTILMFASESQGFGGSSAASTMGSVNGVSIDNANFQRKYQSLYGNSPDAYGSRQALWDYLVEEVIVKEETEATGLGISKQEMEEMLYGARLSPIVQQIPQVMDQTTGAPNRQVLDQIKQMDQTGQWPEQALDFKNYWQEMKGQVEKDRLQTKFSTLISKSVYIPNWMVEELNKNNNLQADFEYVRVPFDAVEDSQVKVTDKDLENYIAENKARYTQTEEMRKLDYVVFNVVPTSADTNSAKEYIAKLIPEWQQVTSPADDSSFISSNSGTYSNGYQKRDAFATSPIQNDLFSLAVGSIIGPYLDGNSFAISKILDRRTLPDSVQVRHILISNQQNVRTDAAAKSLADSLQRIVTPANFAELVTKFSDDGGSKTTGGAYTWSSDASLFPEYYDYAFKTGKPGEFKTIKTAQGGYHIMNIMSYKGGSSPVVRSVVFKERIAPGEQTQERVSNEANAFLNKCTNLEAMKKEATAKGLNIQTSNGLRKNDYAVGALGGGEDSRNLVRWAYEDNRKAGEVSREVYEFQEQSDLFVNKYVVAGLKSIQPAGAPSVASLREEIEPKVKMLKKGEVLQKKITSTDLNAIAAEYSSKVDTARTTPFSTSGLPGGGFEPKVIGAAFKLEANSVSKPIIGEGGVYVVRMVSKNANAEAAAPDMNMMRRQLSNQYASQLRYGLIQDLKKGAKVKDNRSNFF